MKKVTRMLIFLSLSVSAFGGFVYPNAVATDGGVYGGNTTIYIVDHLLNESITSGTQTLPATVLSPDYAYVSANPPTTWPMTITMDFTIAQDLDTFYLWNISHPTSTTAPPKGVKDFTLTFYDAANGAGSVVGSVFVGAAVVEQPGNVDPTIASQAFAFASTYEGVRSVELTLLSSHVSSTGDTWTGLREVGFEAIPEPATLGMVAVFGGAILFIRRKLMI